MDCVLPRIVGRFAAMFVSMLWPSLVVVVCGAIFLRLEMRRRRLTLCGRRDARNSETGAVDGHTAVSSHQTTTTAAPAHGDAANVRPGGRATGSGRDVIARRLPASRGQYLASTQNYTVLEIKTA